MRGGTGRGSSASRAVGKPAGNDLRQGVVTLPTMIYVDGASPASIETLESIVSGDETNDSVIDGVVAEIKASGALEAAESHAREYTGSAASRLSVVRDDETRSYLLDLLHLAVARSA